MKTILVTGGTVFVSKYVAQYYVSQGYEVYVLNRNTRPQVQGVHLIEKDRHALQNALKHIHFDAVIDVTAYDEQDIRDLTDGLGEFDSYVMISSGAVYSNHGKLPFAENELTVENEFWGNYGTDKIHAEAALLERVPDAYILRPPYLYGPMNNIYREAFVFECALKNRPFYLPQDGAMNLQFFHILDLCRFIDCILKLRPKDSIFNVGNRGAVSIRDWVELCYRIAGKEPQYVNVYDDIPQRNYFSFHPYEYFLDVKKMHALMPSEIPLKEGLEESFAWYAKNCHEVLSKPYIQYIDAHLKKDAH